MGGMTMTDLSEQLRDADPLAREDVLSSDHADAIRRAVVAAGRHAPPESVFWPHPLWVAATVALTLSAGIVAGRRLSPTDPVREVRVNAPAPALISSSAGDRRQVHFATPGGTRIIWVLNPEFNP
jgi:hypothetical protein